jgi:hypothetical protein
MTRKKGKPVSFDAMVKFFMQSYNIPTKKDMNKLLDRLDRLEKLIIATASGKRRRVSIGAAAIDQTIHRKSAVTASAKVLEVIKRFNQGVDFAEIQDITGFGEKKLRNIIYRLNDIGRIKRIRRGIYIAA